MVRKSNSQTSPLPTVATALRIWQHSRLVPLTELPEDLQDRILILRNHPKVCAMSHNNNPISYAAHQDYLRELGRRQPKVDCCALFCNAIRSLKESDDNGDSAGLNVLRPIVGVVSVDMRIAGHPLLGLYKNFYHYPHIKMGRTLLFAAMLRASKLGKREVFMECYGQNVAMRKLARQLGFRAESQQGAGQSLREKTGMGEMGKEAPGEVDYYQRDLPGGKKLLQDPMFSDFAELNRESISLQSGAPSLRKE
ncbi:MAG: hypothetical protein AAF975_03825 [Spirochaetota bacterium]